MLEAGALGLPVVCFDGAGGGREYCEAGGGVAVPLLNIEAMAEVCIAWLRDPEKQTRDGARAAEVVRERFTVEVGMPALWSTLQTFLHDAPRLAPIVPTGSTLAEIYATWNLTEAPQATGVAALLERTSTLKQADLFIRQGRRAEAIKLMLHAVNIDLARKDPQILLDSLTEVAAKLAPLEPRQAAFLREQAEALVRESQSRAAA
jgi:hypothetical protein